MTDLYLVLKKDNGDPYALLKRSDDGYYYYKRGKWVKDMDVLYYFNGEYMDGFPIDTAGVDEVIKALDKNSGNL